MDAGGARDDDLVDPFVELDRSAWAALRAATPLTLAEEDLAAVTVGTAVAMPGSVAHTGHPGTIRLEHPSGFSDVVIDLDAGRSAVVSTARLLLEGRVHPRRTTEGAIIHG